MQEINVTYSEIKEVTNVIRSLVSEVAVIELKKVYSKSSINNDIGIDGDDWDDILIPFIEKYNDIDGFLFHDYFHDEAQIGNAFALALLLFPIKILLSLLILPVSKYWAKVIIKFSVLKEKPPIFLGDLIATALVGRFVKRSDYRFILQNPL